MKWRRGHGADGQLCMFERLWTIVSRGQSEHFFEVPVSALPVLCDSMKNCSRLERSLPLVVWSSGPSVGNVERRAM
jgi:hypothetical protein